MQKNCPPRNIPNKVCVDCEKTHGFAHPLCKLGWWLSMGTLGSLLKVNDS